MYAYLDTTVVLRFSVDSVHFAVQERDVGTKYGTHWRQVCAEFLAKVFGQPRLREKAFLGMSFAEEELNHQQEIQDLGGPSDDLRPVLENRKRPFREVGDDGVWTHDEKKGLRLNDPTGQYNTAELRLLEQAAVKRARLLMHPHPNKVDPSDMLVRHIEADCKEETERGLGAVGVTGKQRKKKLKRIIMRAKKTAKKREISRHQSPEFLEEKPFIAQNRCKACGGSHLGRTTLCPILRYHQRKNVLSESVTSGFFVVYPCLVCYSVHHSTVMCPTLHRFCPRCQVRGHAENRCDDADKQERFQRFRHIGLLTRTAERESDPWGYRPIVVCQEDAMNKDIELNTVARATDVLEIYESL